MLSYAGDNQSYVEAIARILRERGVSVFYDKFEEVTLWGKNLQEHFDSIFRLQARYCVMFISRQYGESVWAKQERLAALARAMMEREEYVLPARFDDTEIPGLNQSVKFIDLRHKSADQLGDLILRKLGRG